MDVLVITRKLNDSVQVGTEVEIKVVEIRGTRVKLAITAPPGHRIWRVDAACAAGSTRDACQPSQSPTVVERATPDDSEVCVPHPL